MLVLLLFTVTGALLMAVVIQWHKRNMLIRRINNEHCPVCDADFSEEIFTYLGRIKADEAKSLDKFQQRFAHAKIRCESCGAVCLCAKNGTPMKGYYPDLSVSEY